MNFDNNETTREAREARQRIRAHLNSMAYKSVLDIWPGDPRYLELGKQFSPLRIPLGSVIQGEDNVFWEPSRENNGTILIVGSSGSGKTETLKKIGSHLVQCGYPILVLDFHGDVTFSGLNSVLLSSGSASTVGVNPLDLDCFMGDRVGLYDHQGGLVEMIRRAVPTLGVRQKDWLADAIRVAYGRAGFHEDLSASWGYRAPLFVDVIDILRAWIRSDDFKGSKQSIAGCISAIRHEFDHPVFSRHSFLNVDSLLRRNIRADLSALTDGVRNIVAETLLRMVFRALQLKGPFAVDPKNDSERFRLFILIDETKIFSMGRGDLESSDHILNILATEGRKFGIGLILASQMNSHFGEEVKGNAGASLVMKPMTMDEAKKNGASIGVHPKSLLRLRGKGDGYFRTCANTAAQLIQVKRLLPSFDGRFEKLD